MVVSIFEAVDEIKRSAFGSMNTAIEIGEVVVGTGSAGSPA